MQVEHKVICPPDPIKWAGAVLAPALIVEKSPPDEKTKRQDRQNRD